MYSYNRDSYQVIEWYESKLTGDLLRLQISSYDDVASSGHRNSVFYDFIKVDTLTENSVNWWPYYAKDINAATICEDIARKTTTDFDIQKFSFRPPLASSEVDIGLAVISNAGNGTRRRLDGSSVYDPDYEHNLHVELYEKWKETEEEHYHRRLTAFHEEFGEDYYIYATEQQRRELVGCYRVNTKSFSNSYAIKKYLPIPAISVSYYCDGKTLQLSMQSFGPVTITIPALPSPSFIVQGGGFLNVGPASGGISLSVTLSALPWYLQSTCYAVTWSSSCYNKYSLGTLSATAGSNCYLQTNTFGNFYSDCGKLSLSMTLSTWAFSLYPSAVITLASNQVVGVTVSARLQVAWTSYSETLINSWFKING